MAKRFPVRRSHPSLLCTRPFSGGHPRPRVTRQMQFTDFNFDGRALIPTTTLYMHTMSLPKSAMPLAHDALLYCFTYNFIMPQTTIMYARGGAWIPHDTSRRSGIANRAFLYAKYCFHANPSETNWVQKMIIVNLASVLPRPNIAPKFKPYSEDVTFARLVVLK